MFTASHRARCVRVCLFCAFCLCVRQNITSTVNSRSRRQKLKRRDVLSYLSAVFMCLCMNSCPTHAHEYTKKFTDRDVERNRKKKKRRNEIQKRNMCVGGSTVCVCVCVWRLRRGVRYEVTVWGFMAWSPA